MSRPETALAFFSRSFPRVSGDEPDRGITVDLELAFSPRERG